MAGYKLPAGQGKNSPFVVLILTGICIAECIFFGFLWSITVGF